MRLKLRSSVLGVAECRATLRSELAAHRPWVVRREEERDGRPTPYDPRTNHLVETSNAKIWGTFEEAVKALRPCDTKGSRSAALRPVLSLNPRPEKASRATVPVRGSSAEPFGCFLLQAPDGNPCTGAHGAGIVVPELYVGCDLNHCVGVEAGADFEASAIRKLSGCPSLVLRHGSAPTLCGNRKRPSLRRFISAHPVTECSQ